MLIADGGTISITAGDSIDLGSETIFDIGSEIIYDFGERPIGPIVGPGPGDIELISDSIIVTNPVPLPAGIVFFASGLILFGFFNNNVQDLSFRHFKTI